MSEALAKQGGENIVEIELKTKLDTITHTIIVTGSSKRQLRKMADSIVAAVKNCCIIYIYSYDYSIMFLNGIA